MAMLAYVYLTNNQ